MRAVGKGLQDLPEIHCERIYYKEYETLKKTRLYGTVEGSLSIYSCDENMWIHEYRFVRPLSKDYSKVLKSPYIFDKVLFLSLPGSLRRILSTMERRKGLKMGKNSYYTLSVVQAVRASYDQDNMVREIEILLGELYGLRNYLVLRFLSTDEKLSYDVVRFYRPHLVITPQKIEELRKVSLFTRYVKRENTLMPYYLYYLAKMKTVEMQNTDDT